MMIRLFHRFAWTGLLALILVSVVGALAAANKVPKSGVDDISYPITANDLKPPECAGLNLSTIVAGRGKIKGGHYSSLILGSPDADDIDAGPGTDCVLGGGGNDILRGQNGGDVLLGGPDDDDLNGGNGVDACYGGPGTDTFSNCETWVQ
jgi:Ca2+-binding RTX toxin-like protein